jgi:nucleoside-diphosphate-sugar epimerase
MMSTTSETPVTQRQILLVGPYGVLGTSVIDAVANNPQWGVTTAARRPAPAYRAQSAPPHSSVDLMDREGTKNAFSSLDVVTDLVFAAYVEKPAMAETVEPNASMLKNALGALAAGSVPVQRVVLAGGAKSYGFSLGSSSDVLLCTDLSKSSAEWPLVSLMRNQEEQ